jgi:hypothetical protein
MPPWVRQSPELLDEVAERGSGVLHHQRESIQRQDEHVEEPRDRAEEEDEREEVAGDPEIPFRASSLEHPPPTNAPEIPDARAQVSARRDWLVEGVPAHGAVLS